MNSFMVPIQIFNDGLCVSVCGGSEHIYSVVLAHSLQELVAMRPHIEVYHLGALQLEVHFVRLL